MSARVKAFLWHAGASIIIALCVLVLVFGLWYPAPLAVAAGVVHIFLLVLFVDVIIGPLLTFVVYKAGKRTLVFDLFVVVLLQASALAYGVYTVAQGRPVWVVFNVDRFDLVQAVDVDDRFAEATLPEYRGASWTGPVWVGAVKPEDYKQRTVLLFESVAGGSDIAQRPDLYRPLHELLTPMQRYAQPLQALAKYNDAAAVAQSLESWPAANAWLPLMARAKPMVVLMDGSNGRVLGVVDLNPW